MLGADDLGETLDNTRQIFRSDTRKSLPNSFNGECTNLTDFHPRPSRETDRMKFKRQRKACTLRLAGQRHSDHGAGTLVEDIVTEDQHGPRSGLLTPLTLMRSLVVS